MSVDGSHQQWISGTEAARLLGCVPRQVPKLASRGFLTVRRLPGCDPRYLRSDVERLAWQATQPASVEQAGTADASGLSETAPRDGERGSLDSHDEGDV